MKRNFLYALLCLTFSVIIGGGVYEHLNMVPVWASAPPVSLTMFQGKYGLDPSHFWMLIHPVNLILFIIVLAIHWKSGRRKNLLITMGTYVAILIITSIYFVPELLAITKAVLAPSPDQDLTSRASTWEMLSLVRLVVLVILALILFTGLTKPSSPAYYTRVNK